MNTTSNQIFDFAVVGCGMAGASIAYELSRSGASVIVLEAESYAAYHTTGRSSAFYMEAYGNDTVRNITQTSRSFFDKPPPHFSEAPLLSPSGALYLARKEQQPQLNALYNQIGKLITTAELVDLPFIKEKIPQIKSNVIQNGFWEPHSMEIDVAALLNGYITLAKKQNVQFKFNSAVKTLNFNNQQWTINNSTQATTIINAAGAWAGPLAQLANTKAIDLIPKKRTVCVAKVPGNINVKNWPLTLDIDEKFYFKPEGNNLLITPADETPSYPHDAQAEELEVAQGIDRVQQVVDIEITQVKRKWAGLRTFSSDKSPVVGYDPHIDNFFWLAGQGGYGIQMAPALAKISTSLINKESQSIASKISPSRF